MSEKQVSKTSREQINARQQLFIDKYTDPESDTFSNLYKTGLAVGYSEKYSRAISSNKPEWLPQTKTQRTEMLSQAEKNLATIVNVKSDLSNKMGLDIAKLQIDVSKFVVERLGKGVYGKTDSDDKQGNINIQINNYDKIEEPKEVEAKEVEPDID